MSKEEHLDLTWKLEPFMEIILTRGHLDGRHRVLFSTENDQAAEEFVTVRITAEETERKSVHKQDTSFENDGTCHV